MSNSGIYALHIPRTLQLGRLGAHVDVDEPEVESLRARGNERLEESHAALELAELELELGVLGDQRHICIMS